MSGSQPSRRGRPRAPFDGRALARLARRAGALALRNAPGSESPLAAAREVERAIESWIAREAHASTPRPRVALAHEAEPLPRSEWVLTLDPVDGLDAYLAGLPTWSVVVALLHRGEPWSAAVCAPALRDLYVASSGALRWQGRVISAGEVSPGTRGFVLGKGLEKRSILRLRRRREAEGPISYHACLVARGAAEGAVLGRLNLREAAPLVALLEPVGGELLSLRTGRPLRLESLERGRPSRDPILAAAPGRGAALVARLKK